MPTRSLCRSLSLAAAVCATATLGPARPLAAQANMPQPKVGGASSYDNTPSLSASGNGGGSNSSTRRPLTALAPVSVDVANLTIAPGFLLSMDVYDTPEFSSDLRVDSNGDVTIPMIGAVHVAGMKLAAAANAIAQQLRDKKILNNPQVSLNVSQYTTSSITVLGEVHDPGRIELLAPHNLADVIALAGGETQYAGNQIEVRHAPGSTPAVDRVHYTRDSNDNTLADNFVRPGDTVTVRRAGIVYVLGSVNRPGGYVMQEDGELNLSQALALAYGTNIQAAVGSIRLIRKQPDGRVEEIPVNYRDIVKGKVPSPRLQAEDLVYVPVSKFKTVLTAGLLSSTATATIYTLR